MVRVGHRWAGLAAALVLTVVSLTGVILSVFPLLSADRSAVRLDAGALIEAVRATVPGVEQITVDTNHAVTAVAFGDAGFQELIIDPSTGAVLGPVQSPALELWFENLHRALFLSDIGQMVVFVASCAMVVLILSGFVLAARRLGGWRRLFAADPGAGAGRLHVRIARIAGVGLLVSAVSGVWMGASTLGLIPDPTPTPEWPSVVSTDAPRPADDLAALVVLPGDTIRAITLPRAGVPGEAYMIETDAGAGYVDPVTGQMLTWVDRSAWSHVMDVMHLLHTGQGAAVLGLILGLLSLSVPVLGVSGVLVWANGAQAARGTRRVRPKTVGADAAEVVILVGSEGGTTWRFAKALAAAVSHAGRGVHLAEMSDFAPDRYATAQDIVVLAATYGDGDAPASATGFLDRLDRLDHAPSAALSLVGFGDSSYPQYCGYAGQVAEAAAAKGWAERLPCHRVDLQSVESFADWAQAWGAATGIALGDVTALLAPRETVALTLVAKSVYGEEAQAPTAVLRFAVPKRSVWDRVSGRHRMARFQAGDVLNILPQGDSRARSYSLASATPDGFAEICVRKAPGGLCSTQLYGLEPGDQVTAYVTENARFHAPQGDAPLVLIGAGAGVGALAGMIRANVPARAAVLYFGTHSQDGGYPYQSEFAQWQTDGRMQDLALAYSRGTHPRYVQEALAADAERVQSLVSQGAHLMICGGRAMGDGVRAALDDILAPLGLSVAGLQAEGRYAVDVF